MAHHKKKRPKSRRAGCLMCKYWKHQGYKHRGNVCEKSRTWKQEYRGWLKEKEGKQEVE